MVLLREFLLSCVSFFFFSLLSSQPVPSFYNGVFMGVPGFPVLFFCKQSMFCLCRLGKSLCRFLLLLPSLGSGSFESFWLAILFGTCWGMPFSASPFLAYSFLSYLGGILFCHFLKSFVAILLPCPGSPRPFCCLCHERSLVFLVFFLFLSSFYRSVPVFLFICAWRDLRILASIYFAVVSFWDASSFSGLQDPLGLPFIPHGSSVPITLGLAWDFSFWAWLVLLSWAYFIMTLFRPQHTQSRIRLGPILKG